MSDHAKLRRRGAMAGLVVSLIGVGLFMSHHLGAYDGWWASCVDREEQDYPALEDVTAETLANIEHTVVRVGTCEDTGGTEANAGISAEVPGWSTRAEAIRYLEHRGWQRSGRYSTLTSADGTYSAGPIKAKEPGRPAFIDLRISFAPSDG